MSNYLGGNFETRDLKNYKGYGVQKAWNTDEDGRRIAGGYFYLVGVGQDYVGETYDTLKEAHAAIDTFGTCRYVVWLTDRTTGATSPIDTIDAPVGYTASDYIADCDRNADDDWNWMLRNAATIILEEVEG